MANERLTGSSTPYSSGGHRQDRSREVYRVGDLLVDAGARRVEREGRAIDLTPHALDVLLTLAQHSPDAVSTETLVETVWPDTYIGEENVKQQVMLLRRALGDEAGSPRYVETVRGYGYRLARPAEVQGSELAPDRVFVEVFANRTGDERYEAIALQLCDRIASRLSASRRVGVVRATSAGLASIRGSAAPLERARAAGAGWLLDGAIERHGEEMKVEAALVEVAGGGICSSLPPVAVGERLPEAAVRELVDRSVAALAAALDPSLATLGPGASTPIELAAYDDYAAGLRLFRELRFAEALPRFERAGRRDERFAAARLMKLLALINLARFEEARRTAAALREDDLAPFDRGVLRYHRAMLDGRWAECLARGRELATRAPASAYAFAAGSVALLANRPTEAVERLEVLDPDAPALERWLPYWYYLSLAHHALGHRSRELEVAREAGQRFPAARATLVMELRALAAAGEEGRILERLHAAAATPADPRTALGTLAWVAASELAAHGAREAAGRVARRGLALRAEPGAEPADGRDRARLLRLAGEAERAEDILRPLCARFPERIDLLGERGVTAAGRGDPAAGEIDRRLARCPSDDLGAALFWRAAVAAAAGEEEAAIDLLQRAVAEGFPVWLSPDFLDVSLQLHAHPAFQGLAGDARFRALLWPEGAPEPEGGGRG